MKVELKELEPCRRLLEIEVPAEVVQIRFDRFYAELGKTAKVPGFRSGKAPRNILEMRYQGQARDEVLKRLIPDSYREAMRSHSLVPVDLPEISEVKFERDRPFSFKATVDIRPEIKLGNFKGLKVLKKKAEVRTEEVTKALVELQEASVQYVTVEARPVQMGDYVSVDLEGFVGEASIDKRNDLWLAVDKGSYLAGVPEGLVGARQGETKDINVTLPEDFAKKEFAKKMATFKVRVKEIKEKRLPPLDDELATSLGEFKSLDDLREVIKRDLGVRKDIECRTDVENQILDQLIKRSPFEVPGSLVKRQTDRLVREAKARLLYQGLKKEEIDSQEELLGKTLTSDALRQVKVAFILGEIADREKIEASDGDIERRIKEIARRSNQQPEEVRAYLEEKELLDNLRNELRTQKTLDFLVASAKVKET